MASIWENFSDSLGSLFDDAVDYIGNSDFISDGIRGAGKIVKQDLEDEDRYLKEAYQEGMNNKMPINMRASATKTDPAKTVDYASVEAFWRNRLLNFANYESIANRTKAR